jgi:hypothetical protein
MTRLLGLTPLIVLAALGAGMRGAAGQIIDPTTVPYCDELHAGYTCKMRNINSDIHPTDCEIQANAQVPDGTKAFVKYKNADGTERTMECSVRSMRP